MSTMRGRRLSGLLCGGVSLLFPVMGVAAGQEQLPLPKEPPAAATTPIVKTVTLAECLTLALERQPNLAAARASLAAAHTASASLENLHGVPLLPGSSELPIRRRQACLGVTIADAALLQTQYETYYAVVRTFYSAVYARAQQRVADGLVGNLRFYQERVSKAVNGEEKDPNKKIPKEWTTSTVDKLTIYLRMAESKQTEAAGGVERANAALREATGVGPFCCLRVEDELRAPDVAIALCDIVHLALERRGEIIQANTAVEVFSLEIEAQSKTCLPVARTFAAGSDIHARPVPPAVINGEYRPGALAPEMPVSLAGSKSCRMERAKDFAGRASAVADKTHNLIALEAEDAYYKWLELNQKRTIDADASKAGERLAKNNYEDFRTDQKINIDEVLSDEVLARRAQASQNETVYQYILALAALERITAGGFISGLAPLPCPSH